MVTIIENKCELRGIVLSVQPSNTHQKYLTVKLKLQNSETIGDWPNLGKADVGKEIFINIKADDKKAGEIEIGKENIFIAQKTSPHAYFAK